jgi:NAD-dependent deacetylase
MNSYIDVAKALAKAHRIMILTGAGINTASGIPDFRSQNGLYNIDVDIESVLSERYFTQHPEAFWRQFKDIFQIEKLNNYEPNYGHVFLRNLESQGKHVVIFAQNVDGLHKRAGSQNVYEMHGTCEKAFCVNCGQEYLLPYILKEEIPRCLHDQTVLKPDVVLFGGVVKHLQEAYETISETDVFLTIGSSLTVYPVREIPTYVENAKKIIKVIINKKKTQLDRIFNYVFRQDINKTLKEINSTYSSRIFRIRTAFGHLAMSAPLLQIIKVSIIHSRFSAIS